MYTLIHGKLAIAVPVGIMQSNLDLGFQKKKKIAIWILIFPSNFKQNHGKSHQLTYCAYYGSVLPFKEVRSQNFSTF